MKLRRQRRIQLVVTKPITVKVNGQRQELNYGASVAYRDNSREVLVTHRSVSISGRAKIKLYLGPSFSNVHTSATGTTVVTWNREDKLLEVDTI